MKLYARVRRQFMWRGRSQREVRGSSGWRARRCGRCCSIRRRPDRSRCGGRSWVRGKLRSTVILEQDKSRSLSQRHTAKRIFERLREKHG